MKPGKVNTLNLIVLIHALILGWYQKLFTHSQMGYKPTTFIYLLVLLVYQRMQFSRLKRCWLNSNLMNSDSNSRQMQGFLKEIEFETSFQVHNKASVLMLLILFLRKIFFTSKTSSASLYMAHQQWCATCKYHNIGKTFVFKRINKLTQTWSLKKRILKSVVLLLH